MVPHDAGRDDVLTHICFQWAQRKREAMPEMLAARMTRVVAKLEAAKEKLRGELGEDGLTSAVYSTKVG